MMPASAAADHAAVIKVFQKHLMSSADENAIIGGILPKMASMQVDSNAAASNLANAVNPPIPQAIGDVLAAANEGVEIPKMDIPNELFGGQVDQTLRVSEWQDYLESCIPCNKRVLLRAGLVDLLSDTLLATLEEMINNFLKELAFVMNLLNAPDVYQDACLLLKSLNEVCIPDLQRMLSLFAALLYQLTAEEFADFDLMKLIIAPIFQPIFIGIATLFGQFKGLICDPLECVVTQLDLQIEKLKVGSFLESPALRDIEKGTPGTGKQIQSLVFGEGADSKEVSASFDRAQAATGDWDDGLSAIQNSMGTALMELRNLTFDGVRTVQSKAEELVSEIHKFVGGSNQENITFMLRQYKKLRLIRMIGFISSLVKALMGGFNCDLDGPDAAQHTLAKFFDNFLGPDAPVIVQVDPETQDIKLFFDRTSLQSLNNAQQSLGEAQSQDTNNTQAPIILSPTGDSEVDAALSSIVAQALRPISVKPKCFFKTSSSDSDKLQEFINQLDETEV